MARQQPPWLFVPDATLASLTGRAVEDVVFSRDEMANLAWGIESLLEGDSGQLIDRRRQWTAKDELEADMPNGETSEDVPLEDATADLEWRYQLTTLTPPYWVPFIPELVGDGADIFLRRARMQEWENLPHAERIAGARGRILKPHAPYRLREEAIMRGGVRVTRRYQVARTSDGKPHLWVGRIVQPASGNRSSGRKTDIIQRS